MTTETQTQTMADVISVWKITAVAAAIIGLYGFLAAGREAGFDGPHHDEVIALLAAGAKESSYTRMLNDGSPPLGNIVVASEWQKFTHKFREISFSEVWFDVLNGDLHPPLAFWVLNKWLALFSEGGYWQAVILVWIQTLLVGLILAAVVFRYTTRPDLALAALALFLVGNSAVYTGTWVRQYAFFTACYAGLVAISGDLVRRKLSSTMTVVLVGALGLLCLCGMMTQYTFLTMSAPIHLALGGALILRRMWLRLGGVIAAYAASGGMFFQLMPGVLGHVTHISRGGMTQWQLFHALNGVPHMYLPLPSSMPAWSMVVMGSAGLLIPMCFGAVACCTYKQNSRSDVPDLRIPMAGMLGAGVIQFLMVTLGYFPALATGPHHFCSFWFLTVLAVAVCLNCERVKRIGLSVIVVSLFFMIGTQLLFAVHAQRILPRVNTSYIASQSPDLVCLDNTGRGFVLLATDVMSPEQPVLATTSEDIAGRLRLGRLGEYHRILYLPMDETVKDGKPQIVEAARAGGYNVTVLPVVHTGMYEAILLESHATDTSVGRAELIRSQN